MIIMQYNNPACLIDSTISLARISTDAYFRRASSLVSAAADLASSFDTWPARGGGEGLSNPLTS